MDRTEIARAVRQPKSAAIAGLIFGVLLAVVLVLLHSAAPATVADSGHWLDDLTLRRSVTTALGLMPFAGIAFLWFIAVVRSELGRSEDRFFESVFLGSGLLLVAMLFSASAVLSAVLSLDANGVTLGPSTAAEAWAIASALLGQFGARMAAVFTLSVTSAGLRVRTVPRWLAGLGYLTGLLLLLTPPLPQWAQLLFPAWVITLSLLVLTRRTAPAQPAP